MRTIDDKYTRHIFRQKDGHLPDTPANRKLLEDLANDPLAKIGVDLYGNSWFAREDVNGNQIWVQVRGDRVINGGINNPPRLPDPKTGLAARMPKGRKADEESS